MKKTSRRQNESEEGVMGIKGMTKKAYSTNRETREDWMYKKLKAFLALNLCSFAWRTGQTNHCSAEF